MKIQSENRRGGRFTWERSGKPHSPEKLRFGEPLTKLASGAVAEMLVTADLLRRGFDVFRSVAANAKCDLVVMNRMTGKMLRIQVKSARQTGTGKVCYPKPDGEIHDHVAAVLPNGNVHYFPSL